jgi:hypothetical protein
MSELQPGMLAMIVGSRFASTQDNIGKMVEVIEKWFDGQILVSGDSITKDGEKVDRALCLPIHLLPIKPESDPLDVTDKEELHA